MAANAYEMYARQTRENVTPREAVGKLYNGAAVSLLRAAKAIGEGKLEQANNDILKAEKIVAALNGALDMQVPVSDSLRSLYTWFLKRMLEANIKKDPEILTQTAGFLSELRDTWEQAVRKATAR